MGAARYAGELEGWLVEITLWIQRDNSERVRVQGT